MYCISNSYNQNNYLITCVQIVTFDHNLTVSNILISKLKINLLKTDVAKPIEQKELLVEPLLKSMNIHGRYIFKVKSHDFLLSKKDKFTCGQIYY